MRKILSIAFFLGLFLNQIALAQDYSPDRVLASVRIGERGGCSGTIFLIHEEYAWGISAYHCSNAVGTTFTFGNPDGSEGSGRWIALDRDSDLSMFKTWSKDVLASVAVPGFEQPKGQMLITACGYPRRRGPVYKEVSFRRELYIRNLRNSRWYFVPTWGKFAGGDSGGGVFLTDLSSSEKKTPEVGIDYLVGVMTHGEDDDEIYTATHKQIVDFIVSNAKQFKGIEPFA